MFQLHPVLKKDSIIVGHFPLSVLLLMNDANYPWFVLVPQREDIGAIHELKRDDRHQLLDESYNLSLAMTACFAPDKLNVAALGNVVPQLHMHHVARFENDACWPKPIWGQVAAKPYSDNEYEELVSRFHPKIQQSEGFVLAG
jgi:diadenosine tetraphosphate (Ap4A) HIT family hydrolase